MSRLEQAPCSYIAFGDDQRICDLNLEAAQMLDCPKDQLVGKPIAAVLAPRSRIFFSMHVYPALALHGQLSETYVTLQKPNGEEVATVMNAVRRPRGAGKGQRVECVFLPMRRRRLFEQELIDGRRSAQEAIEQLHEAQSHIAMQDQLASLGMLAAGVAHEINNPLAYVSSNLEVLEQLLRERKEGPELMGLLADVREGIGRIGGIVSSLRTLSRVEQKTQHTQVDLREVLDVSARVAGHQIRSRARFDMQIGPEPLWVRGDAGRLGQVLLNLLINAVQALPESRSGNLICLRARHEHGRALIEVEDNGFGIAPEIRERLFEPFFTTKPVGVGTGLGLSVCKGIVTALGGTIGVSSEPGQGACFQVALPLMAADEPASPALPAQAAGTGEAARSGAQPRVLIIDDDQHVAGVMKRALRQQFDVTAVHRSSDALALLTAQPFDVILCDLMMPELSGSELYHVLARSHPRLAERIVFLTGGTFDETTESFLKSVTNQCISKPFSNAALRAACADMARRHAG